MITFENVNYSYPNSSKTAINNISLTINRGEMVLVTGVSGSGKSTLLRCINGLVPHFSGGSISGGIRVDDHDPVRESPKSLCRVVGFVFQDPESQFVMDQVEDEIAFVLENFAMPPDEIGQRIDRMLPLLKLDELRHRQISTLSGGEQQRVAIASVMALQPSILVLDEPTSQLDPSSAENLLCLLKDLNERLHLTIILSEHRLERVLPFTHRVLHIDPQGHLEAFGPPRQVFKQIDIEVPLFEAAKKLDWPSIPLSVEEARCYSQRYDGIIENTSNIMSEKGKNHPPAIHNDRRDSDKSSFDPPFIQIKNLEFSFDTTPVIADVSLDIRQGEIVILMGENGAGKSTLCRCIVGLLKPHKGVISLNGQDVAPMSVANICREVAYLPQDPNMMLFADHVEDELWITLHNHQCEIPPITPDKLLSQLGLSDKSKQYPRDLSTGERQRVALGAILVTKPTGIMLDEPTRGLDYAAKRNLIDLLKSFQNEGKAILLITHDVEFAAQIADKVVILDKGKIIKQGSPQDVFLNFPPFTTQMAQAFPGTGWIIPQDI